MYGTYKRHTATANSSIPGFTLGVTRQMTSSASLFSERGPASLLSNPVFQSSNSASNSSVFQASNPAFLSNNSNLFERRKPFVHGGWSQTFGRTVQNLIPEEMKDSCTTYAKKNSKRLKETHPSKMQGMDAFQWKHMVKLEGGELVFYSKLSKQLNTLLVKSQEHDIPADLVESVDILYSIHDVMMTKYKTYYEENLTAINEAFMVVKSNLVRDIMLGNFQLPKEVPPLTLFIEDPDFDLIPTPVVSSVQENQLMRLVPMEDYRARNTPQLNKFPLL